MTTDGNPIAGEGNSGTAEGGPANLAAAIPAREAWHHRTGNESIRPAARRSGVSLLTPRDLAYCGLFGAAALLLPVLFHMINLGHVFMPMYLPLVLLAFYVRPLPSALTALAVPLLSAGLTGMPPLFPPVAWCMALELAGMALIISGWHRRWPRTNPWLILIPVLLAGRFFQAGLVYLCSLLLELPAGFLAGLSIVSGWPGILLMLLVIPSVLRATRPTPAALKQQGPEES